MASSHKRVPKSVMGGPHTLGFGKTFGSVGGCSHVHGFGHAEELSDDSSDSSSTSEEPDAKV